MADREKLIELLFVWQVLADAECDKQAECNKCQYSAPNACRVGFIADHLIANGVTIQRWIPVTERLPEEDVLVLCIGAKGGMFLGYPRFVYKDDGFAYTRVPNARGSRHATHWMPLPEPPKGE